MKKKKVHYINTQSLHISWFHKQEAMAASQLFQVGEKTCHSHTKPIWDTWYQDKIFTVGRNLILKRSPKLGCHCKVGQISQTYKNGLTIYPRTDSQDFAGVLQARNTTAACFPLNLGTFKGQKVQKQVGNEGEEQLSALFLKLRKLLFWVVDTYQFLFYPNWLLIL